MVNTEFGLHELAIEDAVSESQRPKLDHYATHLFLSAYTVTLDAERGRLDAHEDRGVFITDLCFPRPQRHGGPQLPGGPVSTIDLTIMRARPASQRRCGSDHAALMNRVRQVRKASSPNAASDMAESSPLPRATAPTTLRLSDLARGIVDGPEDRSNAPRSRSHAAG
jgi:Mg2+ and Co2+ transporter CorA